MVCPDCGNDNEDGSPFCSSCGKDLQDGNSAGTAADQTEHEAQQETTQQPRKTAGKHGAHSIEKPGDGKATASFICGIAAIVLSPTIVLGIILGCAAFILGGLAVKDGPNRMARRGAICSVVGVALSVAILVVSLVFGVWVFGGAASNPDEVSSSSNTSSTSGGSSVSSTSVYSSTASSGSSQQSSAGGTSTSSAASSASSNAVQLNNSYMNDRFGFSVGIPDGFVQGTESQNGDDVTFTDTALNMTVRVYGYNNTDNLSEDAVMKTVWNGSTDSIKQTGDGHVFIYQYDSSKEYFYWIYLGAGSINRMEISYPLQDDNGDEMAMAEAFMGSFVPGDLTKTH
jgi:hypothetical protein